MPTIIGQGEPRDREAFTLLTRKGRHIPNEKRPEAPPSRMKAAAAILNKAFPNARLRSSTQVYNCMGLVFAARRTWILYMFSLPAILEDDEYRQLGGIEEATVGDLVVYGTRGKDEAQHVGVIIEKKSALTTASWEVIVLSKWGADGEYIHEVEDVPALCGKPLQFWTDRKVLI